MPPRFRPCPLLRRSLRRRPSPRASGNSRSRGCTAMSVSCKCAPRSHTRAATRRSARSKRKSTRTSSSPSSGTRTPPCSTRRTSGYSSGSTSRACWTRRTRAPSSSLVMSWNAFVDSRIAGCRWARGQFLRAGENGCYDRALCCRSPMWCSIVLVSACGYCIVT